MYLMKSKFKILVLILFHLMFSTVKVTLYDCRKHICNKYGHETINWTVGLVFKKHCFLICLFIFTCKKLNHTK